MCIDMGRGMWTDSDTSLYLEELDLQRQLDFQVSGQGFFFKVHQFL
jgi:hypothetical protein